mgnify:CR=1 FL=1
MPRVQAVAEWQAKVLLLQETKLTELQQLKAKAKMTKEGWSSFMGKPSTSNATSKKGASAACAERGGVAIECRKEVPVQQGRDTADTMLPVSYTPLKLPTDATV